MELTNEILLHFSTDVLSTFLILYLIPHFFTGKVVWKKFVSFDTDFFDTIIGRYTLTLLGIVIYFTFFSKFTG
jgi:hypothetical protein